MHRSVVCFLVPWALCASFLSSQVFAQEPDLSGEARLAEPAAQHRGVVLEGRVLLPSGRPAAGAVVVSSAGGKAATDELGRFELPVELASTAERVRVTAVKGAGAERLLASAEVVVDAFADSIPAGMLELGSGGGCQAEWLPTFGGQPGVSGTVTAMAVFDDGAGPALYVAGDFPAANGIEARSVARWDGASWSGVGSGIDGQVYALAVFDDGTGPELYAGGEFSTAGAAVAHRIAKWDGVAWSGVGGGLQGGSTTPSVNALLVIDDDGDGRDSLVAGGSFLTAGGVSARRVAKWNGASWSALGAGTTGPVFALAAFDDGGGEALYVGGNFLSAGGAPANRIARWDGAAWSTLASGTDETVHALTVFDDGAGAALYAAGSFEHAGGVRVNQIARWDGAQWSALGSGLNGVGGATAYALLVHDDGAGPRLYVTGWISTAGGVDVERIASWDGASWEPLGEGLSATGRSLGSFGGALFAGGSFGGAGGVAVVGIAQWEDGAWSSVGEGIWGAVNALAVFDDGSGGGPALFAAGTLSSTGAHPPDHIGKWDGASWSPLGTGLNGSVYALGVFDDGSGAALFAGGTFTLAGGVPASRVARWDGSSWSPLGTGVDGPVHSFVVHDDGNGPALYVAGTFQHAGAVDARSIARWDGTSWSALGQGLAGIVDGLAVFDDGSGAGPQLFACGGFTVSGGTTLDYVGRWDGSNWWPLGSGAELRVTALCVFDDGGGERLFAGGYFDSVDGVLASHIAAWDGASWSALGTGLDGEVFSTTVLDLEVFDDGSGPALYAAGRFHTAGGVAAGNLARWDGATWSPLGSGTNGSVNALAVLDADLFAGGEFQLSPAGDSLLARYGCDESPVGEAYCFGDGSGTPCPCGNASSPGRGCANSSGVGALLAGAGSTSVGADDLTLHASDLLAGQPALLFVGEQRVNGGAGIVFGDGLRCADVGVRRLAIETPSPSGAASWGPGLSGPGHYGAGDTRRFQVWYRDPSGPCASGFDLTNALELRFTP